jgi:hypothetical protein
LDDAAAGIVPIRALQQPSHDPIGAAQLTDLSLQLGDALPFGGRHASAAAAVDLGLADPAAQRLGTDTRCRAMRVITPTRSPVWSMVSSTMRKARSRSSGR